MNREPLDLLSRTARASSSSAIRDLLRLTEREDVLSLAGGLPAAELFPVDELRAVMHDLLADPRRAAGALQYGPTEGSEELRAQVEARYRSDRAMRSAVITTGSQQALDLVGRVLLDPGDVVVAESPTYLGALQAFAARRPHVTGVPVDADGLDVDHLAGLLSDGLRPKLCYVVPNFSNPSGATLSLARRQQLVALADSYGFVIVEDDPYGELRFCGDAMPSMARSGDMVVTLGSASKVLAPGLRVGWMMAPPWMIRAVVRAKQASDLHTSSLSQAVVAAAVTAAWFEGHLERLRNSYAARADTLCGALGAHDVFTLDRRPLGGMFAWVRVTGIAVDTASMLRDAVANGVAYVPGAAFGAESNCMRLCFATLAGAQLAEAVHRLARTALAPTGRVHPRAPLTPQAPGVGLRP